MSKPPDPLHADTPRGKIVTPRARIGDSREHLGEGVVAPGGYRVSENDWGARHRAWLRRKQRKIVADDE